MSESMVIARRFRPKLFDEVIGQEAITRTLRNSIKLGRVHHAYLFTGARGVGKTTTARILAKALTCETGITAEPCGVCSSCQDIASARAIHVLEIDAASNTGVDNVRQVIIDSIDKKPGRARFKIFIIDEVHMLSGPAFNALLKTLEEPPSHIVFIMATTELHKVPDTILSRCQVFEFRTISVKRIFEQLRMISNDLGIQISDSALLAIARAGEGSMRDAESALDQVISFAGKTIEDQDVSAALGLVDLETLNTFVRAIAEQNALQVITTVEEIVSRGYDLRNLCRELMLHFRALLVVKVAGFDQELLQMPASEGESLVRLADAFSEQDLLRFFSILTKTEQDIRVSSQPRFQLEMGLMKLIHAGRLYLLEEALQRMQDLESRLNGTGSLPPEASAPPSRMPPQGNPASGSPASGGPRRGSLSEVRSSLPVPAPNAPVARADQERPSDMAPVPVSSEATVLSAPPPAPPVEAVSVGETPGPGEEIRPDAFPAAPVGDAGSLIRKALEERRKMLLASTLGEADCIEADGNYLCISFPKEKAYFKSQIETRDNRRLIEEVCRELFGRSLTLSVSVGGKVKPAGQPEDRPQPVRMPKPKADSHPMVKALVDKFHGEVVDVVEPDM